MVSNPAQGLHSTDIKRLTEDALKGMGAEEFTGRWQHKDRKLTLTVNGKLRNSIILTYAEDKFEELLQWVKNQFIAWRNPKN